MPPGRLTDARLLAIAGVLTVMLAAATAWLAPPEDQAASGPSSYSAGSGGGRAAFLTLRELGYDVRRSSEPMTAVTADPARTALIVTGPAAPSDQDRRAMQAFLTGGGTALLIGAPGAAFLGMEPGRLARASLDPPSTHRAVTASPLAEEALEISMASPASAPQFAPSYVTVFAASPDEPLVTTARIGAGRAVWLAAPTPLANAHIASAGNLRLLLNAIGPAEDRIVLWDEHYHGHRRSLWSYAAGTPLPWIGLQAGLLALAAFAAFSRRRGPVRARRIDARTSPLEFIDMLRVLYGKAGARRAAIASAHRRLRRTIASVCGVPADASFEALARASAARRHVDENEVREALAEGTRAAEDPDIDSAAAIKITARLQNLTAALTGADRSLKYSRNL